MTEMFFIYNKKFILNKWQVTVTIVIEEMV